MRLHTDSSHAVILANQVILKALLVLHSMIRQGATDNVLTFLSNNDVLRLKDNVGGQTWEGWSFNPYTEVLRPRLTWAFLNLTCPVIDPRHAPSCRTRLLSDENSATIRDLSRFEDHRLSGAFARSDKGSE